MFAKEMNPAERELAINWMSSYIKLPFPSGMMPQHGITVLQGKVPVVIMGVYMEAPTSIAVLGFCITNPTAAPRLKHNAVKAALEFAQEYAAGYGRKHLVSVFGNRSINAIARRLGMKEADRNVEQLYIYVGGGK